MAEKIYYDHDYPNDTTYIFERDPDGRGQITMTFTSEDIDYGTEELIYGGDGTENELRADLLKDLTECLDLQEQGYLGDRLPVELRYYDEEFIRSSLIAFEAMLLGMSEGESKCASST